jgi:hypothetical protein
MRQGPHPLKRPALVAQTPTLTGMAGRGRCCERSHARFTDEHLERLAAIARVDQRVLFARKAHLAIYGPRLLIVTLCQGGGLHYLDCLKGKTHTNGVKDLDVYTTNHNKTPRLLREKGVVGLHPARYRGWVIWDPDTDLQHTQVGRQDDPATATGCLFHSGVPA